MPVSLSAYYPSQIAPFTARTDLRDIVYAADVNALEAEVAALETVIGTSPTGASATLRDRCTAIESSVASIKALFDGESLLPQSGVESLVSDLATITSNVEALQSGVTSIDSSLTSINTAIVGIEEDINTINNYLVARPLGYQGSLIINAGTDAINAHGGLLSASGTVFKTTLSLASGREYLMLFTCPAIVDEVQVGSGSHAALHLSPYYQLGDSISVGGGSPMGEVRMPILTGLSAVDESSGTSHHTTLSFGSGGTDAEQDVTFAVYGWTSHQNWEAQLLPTGGNGDYVNPVPAYPRLSIFDLGQQSDVPFGPTLLTLPFNG